MSKSTKTNEAACRVCGNKSENTFYTAREMMYGLRESFDYFQCSQCECLQIVDMIEDMSKYYPSDYYSFSRYNGKFKGINGWLKKKRYELTIFNKSFLSSFFLMVAGKKGYDILSTLSISKSDRILDVGCGNGEHFLYPLAEIGFTNLMGCDPFIIEEIDYDNGVSIKKESILEVNDTFDIITYHHAFEHLPNPSENLDKVNELLSDKGVCIIRIPTVSSYAWQHYQTDWVQLDAPRHFFLHSVKSMEILAEQNGLELFKVEYDSSHFQFTGSELYLKDIPLKDMKLKEVKKNIKQNKSRYSKKAKLLNQESRGDQAAFYLRKKTM